MTFSAIDQKLLSQPDILFDADEVILWIGRPNLKVVFLNACLSLCYTIMLLLLFLLFLYILRWLNNESFTPEGTGIFAGILLVVFAGSTISDLSALNKTTYLITDRSIIIHRTSGKTIIQERSAQYTLAKKTLIDQLFHTGDIRIYIGKTRKNEDGDMERVYDYLTAIADPEQVYQVLSDPEYMINSNNI